tara:strand:- start:169 stop:327 length:159 start_codon:yes stop_codon:yes gene_type:complete
MMIFIAVILTGVATVLVANAFRDNMVWEGRFAHGYVAGMFAAWIGQIAVTML